MMFLEVVVLLGLSTTVTGKADTKLGDGKAWEIWNKLSYCTNGSYVEGSNRTGSEEGAEYVAYKSKLFFSWFDIDKDKMTSLENVEVAMNKLVDLQHLVEEQSEKLLIESISWAAEYILWGRSNITEAEFVRLQMQLYNTDKLRFYNRMKTLNENVFDLIDSNHDALKDLREQMTFLWAGGHKNVSADLSLFNALRPVDGKVPKKANVKIWLKFQTCEDSSIPDVVKTAFESKM